MPRGGARSGAGRKATDCPGVPLSTYSFRIRLEDTGVLNRLGDGNLSLGLRRGIHLPTMRLLRVRSLLRQRPATSNLFS